jgi:hypothetical protein
MSTTITLRFTRLHSWRNTVGFDVWHTEGNSYLPPYDQANPWRVPIWQTSWEQAGFAHGDFGSGHFGWGQGVNLTGGFGLGRFACGELGYHNETITWTTPQTYHDGLHFFSVMLWTKEGMFSSPASEQSILIANRPAPPRVLQFVSMTDGELSLRWTKSPDI